MVILVSHNTIRTLNNNVYKGQQLNAEPSIPNVTAIRPSLIINRKTSIYVNVTTVQ